MLEQVYETVLHEEFLHSLAAQAPFLFNIHVQVPKDNGVPEVLYGLLKVSQVFQYLGCQVRSNRWGTSESNEYLAAYHVFLWLRVDSMPHPTVLYLVTRPTPP